MGAPTPSAHDRGGSPPGVGELDDPGDANQLAIIRQLNDARATLTTRRDDILVAQVNAGGDGELVARKAYRQAVASYAMLLAPYLRAKEFAGDDLWDEELLGVTEVDPPTAADVDGELVGDELEPEQISAHGIRDLLFRPSPITVTWRVTKRDVIDGEVETTVERAAELSRETLDHAVIRLDEFRRDVGLALTMPEERDDSSGSAYQL